MPGFKSVIDEINSVINNILIFEQLLTSLVIFLACYLLFDFLVIESIDPFYALFPAAAYFVVVMALKYNKSKVIEVEKKYPALDERIRTAEDNLDKSNDIVLNLQEEIKRKLKNVESASFFRSRETTLKIIASVILCFLIIFMNSFNYGGINVKTIFPPPKVSHLQLGDDDEGASSQFAGGPGGGSNIETDQTGISGVAELGEEELELSLDAEGYELNIRDVKEVKKRVFDEVFPSAVGSTSAAVFEENIPKEQQEVVNNYFKSIAED